MVLGNACLDSANKPSEISTYRTQVLENGRPSFLQPCASRLHIKHEPGPDYPTHLTTNRSHKKGNFFNGRFEDGLGNNVFLRTRDDNKPGTSVEDRKFIDIMNRSLTNNISGSWETPLPLRETTKQPPNNQEHALKRLKSTCRTLDKKPLMKQHYFEFMQKLFNNGHAEPAPSTESSSSPPRWYLPHFGVYHPQKPGKIRVVFDSAAETNGVSLNKMLLSGPDLTNSLLGILIRFRQDPVAFMADIEQMFHSFVVREDHRDLLRFF